MNVDTPNEVSKDPRGESALAAAPLVGVHRTRLLGLPIPAAILLAGLVAFFALRPLDPIVNGWVATATDPQTGWLKGGDIRREWSALQQFGQGTSIALIAIVIYLLDRAPHRRARLLDFALALAMVGIAVTATKCLIGRPRPRFNDPHTILWPWGTYDVPLRDSPTHATAAIHAWDFSKGAGDAQLWSLPSSHTAFAVVTALFLSVMYPRLRWVALFLAAVVATGRLIFDAHWLTDVIAGAAVAAAIAWPILNARPLSRRWTHINTDQPGQTPQTGRG